MPFSFIACNLSYCGHYGIGLEFQSYHSFHLSGEHEFGACYAITAEDSPSFILDWLGCLNNAHPDVFPCYPSRYEQRKQPALLPFAAESRFMQMADPAGMGLLGLATKRLL